MQAKTFGEEEIINSINEGWNADDQDGWMSGSCRAENCSNCTKYSEHEFAHMGRQKALR